MTSEQKSIERIKAYLRAGHGSEDIAITLGLNIEFVRDVVRRFRANGNFDDPEFFLPLKRKRAGVPCGHRNIVLEAAQ